MTFGESMSESVSKKPPEEVESMSQPTLIDGTASELDREIALHLPPTTDAEVDAGIHSPTQATSPSLRRIARSRARSRQAWLLAALFAGFACVALLWMSLFPSSGGGSGPEPRVSIESSRTAGLLPPAVPAVQTATAPEQTPEHALAPAPIEATAPVEAASAVSPSASSSSAPEPARDPAPLARRTTPSVGATRLPAVARPRIDKPNPQEETASARARENAAAESAPSPAPAPSSKFVFQPQ
jgi:hypothetical protein